MKLPHRPRTPTPPDDGRPAAAPQGARICDAVAGPRLCDVRVWSEAEWSALAEADRPREHAYFPGLGWVGVVPVVGLN